MKICFDGIGHESVTFPAGTCRAGALCKLDATGKATLCTAGDRFCGMAEVVENGMAAVQLHGFVTVGYTGTAPAAGYANLSADGNGGVKTDSAGATYLVASVNTAEKTAVIEL